MSVTLQLQNGNLMLCLLPKTTLKGVTMHSHTQEVTGTHTLYEGFHVNPSQSCLKPEYLKGI